MAELPRPFGPYLLIEALPSYGAGEVFLAMDPSLEGDPACVIKRLAPDRRGAADAKTRFRREAHLARRLSHETLVTTLAVGDFEDEPYMVQEFVEGHALSTVLDRCSGERRCLPIDAAVFVAHEIARALDYVHGFEGLKLVHRDVSPVRIRLGYEGQAKLLEPHGGRPAAKSGAAVLDGACVYAAPEQLAGQPIDGRADVYALGALLWEALAGRPLGGEAHTAPLGEPHVPEAPAAPSAFNAEVPAELDQVVLRMLAREPERRFASARDVEGALAALNMPRGQDSLAALMNRLFDAQHERKQRAALLVSARKAVPAGATQLVVVNPAAATEERELPRMPRNEPPSTDVPRRAADAPTEKPVEPRESPATRSVTIHLRQAGPWLRRFFLFFGVALLGAVAFNRYMTARLHADWREEEAAPAPAVPAPKSAASATPPVVEAQPVKLVEAQVVADAAAPAAVAPAAAVVPSPSAAPDARPRQLTATQAEVSKAVASLDRARAAFERDDFAKAVELGEAALLAGDRRAHAVLGAAYFKLGRYREAERAYNEAARVEPDNAAFRKRAESAHRMAEGHADAASP